MESSVSDGYASYIRDENGHHTLTLKVGGAHCAGCIQKIESKLYEDRDVIKARLNFTTGTLSIIWDGDENNANRYAESIKNLGYQVTPFDFIQREGEQENRFLILCLGVAGFAMGGMMALSFSLWYGDLMGMDKGTRAFMHWVSAIIAVPAIIFSGRPFFRSAFNALKNKRTNMDVPISLALILATGMSVHELVRHAEHVYFDSAIMLCFFLLVGRYLDFRARSNARSAATDLMSTLQGFAVVLEDGGQTRRVPIRDVKADSLVMVATGDKIPVDGVIVEGQSSIDTSLVTGETIPRSAGEGDEVYAGTMNLDAPLKIRVLKAAEDSLLADIVRLMDQAGQSQAVYTRLADRAARLYTPFVHSLAAAAFVMWFFIFGASWQDALLISVTVLIITCPCALGLAVPVAQVLATGRLLKDKILVKSGDALERLASIDTIFLDKTGTLTKGKPALIGEYDPEALAVAASIAQNSSHPLSKALVAAFEGDYVPVSNIKEIAGHGVEATLDEKNVRLGSRRWCGTDEENESVKGPEIWLNIEGKKPVRFLFQDSLRADTKATLQTFKERALSLSLLSGDRQDVVQQIAEEAGIDDARGNLTPPEKYERLQTAKSKNHKVLMVGDGLNDAPVLAGADVSIAPGTAIDMAQNAADIVFMGENFSSVLKVHTIAVRTQKIIRQNFMIAILYNIIAVPIAFMGLVTPMIAAICMSGSSLLVILNSFRLRLLS